MMNRQPPSPPDRDEQMKVRRRRVQQNDDDDDGYDDSSLKVNSDIGTMITDGNRVTTITATRITTSVDGIIIRNENNLRDRRSSSASGTSTLTTTTTSSPSLLSSADNKIISYSPTGDFITKLLLDRHRAAHAVRKVSIVSDNAKSKAMPSIIINHNNSNITTTKSTTPRLSSKLKAMSRWDTGCSAMQSNIFTTQRSSSRSLDNIVMDCLDDETDSSPGVAVHGSDGINSLEGGRPLHRRSSGSAMNTSALTRTTNISSGGTIGNGNYDQDDGVIQQLSLIRRLNTAPSSSPTPPSSVFGFDAVAPLMSTSSFPPFRTDHDPYRPLKMPTRTRSRTSSKIDDGNNMIIDWSDEGNTRTALSAAESSKRVSSTIDDSHLLIPPIRKSSIDEQQTE